MLSKKTIDEVNDIPIEQAIGKYIELKKSGSGYIGKSPFTDEKTPSFNVHPSKGIWKCFSSGNGGNSAISFVMKLKGLSYPETIKDLADKFNIIIEYDDSDRAREYTKREETKKSIYDVNALALEWFKSHTSKIPDDKIRCTAESFERFNIGFAPEHGGLGQHLIEQGISRDLILQAGLIGEDKEKAGHFYDVFRGRVVFPIYSNTGKLLGFSGRTTNDAPQKYLNTRETDAFHKSQSFFGLFQALESIKSMKFAVLVEGNYDVTALAEQGFPNTVAGCGTALSDDQIKLLQRYTDSVVICADNDKAGLKALEKNVPLLLKNGIKTFIFIPGETNSDTKTDAWDFTHSKKWAENEFFELFMSHRTDAVEYLANKLFEKSETIIERANATNKLTELLAHVADTTLRNQYVKSFVKPFGIDRRMVESQIKTEIAKKAPEDDGKDKPRVPTYLTPDDISDLEMYGFYEDKNPAKIGYWFANQWGKFEPVTNFLVRPIFQVRGNDSKRILEIQNKNKKALVEVSNKAMTSAALFEEVMLNEGNFDFHGNKTQFQKIRLKLQDKMPICTEIRTLGWQRDGFFAFSDGIVENGIFKKVDNYGICYYVNEPFFLPAFSSIYENWIDGEDAYENDRNLRYKPSGINFSGWAEKVTEVYGDNGKWVVLFCIASTFRDYIFNSLTYFPYLFMFGQTRTGKSACSRSAQAPFFGHQTPFNLSSGTPVGFNRKLARSRNTIVWFDEYDNGIDEKRLQTLKGGYDGAGYEKGTLSRDNRTEKTPINSAAVISGQHLPTRNDNALFSRSIMLTFSVKAGERSIAEEQRLKELETLEKSGLSNIVVEIVKFRDYLENEFNSVYFSIIEKLKTELSANEYDGRVLKNYAILIAMSKIFEEKLNIPFSYKEAFDLGVKGVLAQSEQINDSDDLRQFLQTLEYMSVQHIISNKKYYIVENRTKIKIRDGRNADREITFPEETRVLFLRFSQVHALYLQEHRKLNGTNGISEQSIISYMRTHKAFIGNVSVKNFDGEYTSAYCFKYDLLGINLKEIPHKNKDKEDKEEGAKPLTIQTESPMKDDDMPF